MATKKQDNTGTQFEEPTGLYMPFEEALKRFSRVNTKDLTQQQPIDENKLNKATPFVKWVGGKRSIITELTSRLPSDFGAYYEAFAGGGALFFEIADRVKKATIVDINIDLVFTYLMVQKQPEQLITLLRKHAANHSEEYYYKVRAQHKINDPIEKAARFLYLNKTCFNGLYRVNRKGEFNVPIGKYTNPNIIAEDNIRACHKALKGVKILYGMYSQITPEVGDFVYFDPPYHPTDTTSFTAYSQNGFTEKDQQDLRDFALELHKKGIKVMLSNSKTPFVEDLYKSKIFNIEVVNAPRFVNCKPNKRNAVEEVLITNYKP